MTAHDFTFALPGMGSSVTLEGRSLAKDELSMKLRYDDGEGEVEGEISFFIPKLVDSINTSYLVYYYYIKNQENYAPNFCMLKYNVICSRSV